jgi:SAM-dependent methyltransferase
MVYRPVRLPQKLKKLPHKLEKLVDGRTLASARRHALRLLRANPFSLDTKRVIDTIDLKAFDHIRQRYALKRPTSDWPKFLDLERWIDINIRRVREVELDLMRPKRILDVGCGAGYFLYIAQLLGHEGLGLDLDQLPMFRDITRLLGARRVIRKIKAFDPLPDLGKFDVITAFLICFNNHKQPDLWSMPEWEFFLNDLARHLAPRGRVWLELNQEYDGTFYTPELKEFFQKRGAKIDRHKVIFNSGLPSPVSISPVAR